MDEDEKLHMLRCSARSLPHQTKISHPHLLPPRTATPTIMPPSSTTLPQSFLSKKEKILETLSVPADQYNDLSPKGSVDEGIRDLIDEINALPGCVTTSSCAGRISVFLEGKKGNSSNENIQDGDKIENEGGERPETQAGIGGKGGGGHWLFVSHGPVDLADRRGNWIELLGMEIAGPGGSDPEYLGTSPDIRFIHFKFEPMVRTHHRLSSSWESR